MKGAARLFRFRLRTLLLIVALTAGGASLWRVKQQQEWYRKCFEFHRSEEAVYAKSIREKETVLQRWTEALERARADGEEIGTDWRPRYMRWHHPSIFPYYPEILADHQREQRYHRQEMERYQGLLYFGTGGK